MQKSYNKLNYRIKMKLPNISGKKVIKILSKYYGWEIHRRKGSHITLKKENEKNILTVPFHEKIRIGTLLSILRKAEIDKEDFITKL